MDNPVQKDAKSWSFGSFQLSSREMLLTDNGTPVRLGSRAFAILVALVEHAGEVVSVSELLARGWPNIFVEEVTLRVHLHALKKVLGDGRESARYIVNETGRGYRFVVPVTAVIGDENEHVRSAATELPIPITRIVGRSTVVDTLRNLIPGRRFLTLVGTGGVGKTTVAIAVAERLRSEYLDEVHFIDLTTLSEPRFVANAVASPFGLSLPATGGVAMLATYLTGRRLLLVLDNCEHLADAVAELAEAIHRRSPNVHILCTSREPLRAEGEWIYRLSGLTLPPRDEVPGAEALEFSAIQLFVERTIESQESFELTDANVASVCRICRRLDGLPLALELAAANLHSFSVIEFSDLLEDQFALVVKGRRTATPRQQTMRATLDWSHALLSAQERILFRRLAVFRSAFDLQSAIQCCTCSALGPAIVTEGIGSLTAKSLLHADVGGDITLFRLLESTRAYAKEQLSLTDESVWLNRSHAELMRDKLNQAAEEWRATEPAIWLRKYGRLINDIRAALDWALGPDGNATLGVTLTNLTGSLAYDLSLISEFRTRFEKAFALLPVVDHDAVTELQLATNFAKFLFHAGGPHDKAIALALHAVTLAEELASDFHTIEAMAGLWVMGLSVADYAAMDRASNSLRHLAERSGDRIAELFSIRMGATSATFVGDLGRARQLAQLGLDEPAAHVALSYHAPLTMDRHTCIMPKVRAMFLQGEVEAGLALALEATERASKVEHQQSFMVVSGLLSCPIAFWYGDWQLTAELIVRFKRHIDRYSATYYRDQWAFGFDQALRLCEQGAIGTSPVGRFDTLLHDHLCTIHGDFVTPAAFARAKLGQAGWAAPEIFRSEGNRLLRSGADPEGEVLLRQAIELAQCQGARFWELRAATDLASQLQRTGKEEEASRILAPIYAVFAKGPHIPDVQRAASLWKSFTPLQV